MSLTSRTSCSGSPPTRTDASAITRKVGSQRSAATRRHNAGLGPLQSTDRAQTRCARCCQVRGLSNAYATLDDSQ